MTTQPTAPNADGYRPLAALGDAGLLWLFNRTTLHPRGLTLAFCADDQGEVNGWKLQPSPDGEPWSFDPTLDADGYRRAEATLTAALAGPTADPPPFAEQRHEEALTCICGAPVEWVSRTEDFGWRHSPAAGRSCQRARPRCPECHTPHALLPGEPPMCGGLREGVIVPAATEATDPLTPPADDEEGNGVRVISTSRVHRDGGPDGVRIVYTARVPRDQGFAAFAEAFEIIDRETGNAARREG
ncbi:hypothetical protein OG235_36690 [Streptomyces sp. NBC_00024]|uniref:hypothetical protein n=1 Tax=Streptomyces sp. NBC_00024 TaxID=2903612 RepID=UPI00324E6963